MDGRTICGRPWESMLQLAGFRREDKRVRVACRVTMPRLWSEVSGGVGGAAVGVDFGVWVSGSRLRKGSK